MQNVSGNQIKYFLITYFATNDYHRKFKALKSFKIKLKYSSYVIQYNPFIFNFD